MARATSIRVGVVGLGYFGSHHARHYAANPSAHLVAVVDTDASRAFAMGMAYGAEGLSDHRALIGRVDAVSIAAPTSLHHTIARDLIDAGIHVFVEKPIAATVADAADLVARADKAGVALQVGHIERFSPAYQALAKRVRALRNISCVRHAPWKGRAADVDVVLDLMIHDIDLVLALAGAPVASVTGSGLSTMSGLTDEAEAWLTFTNGAIATLSASRVAPTNERRLTVTEPGMAYVADLAGPTLSVARRGSGAIAEMVPLAGQDNLGAEIAAFLDSIATGAPPLVDGRTGAAALAVAERIQAAIADGAVPARRSL